jgi:hypothetical protein
MRKSTGTGMEKNHMILLGAVLIVSLGLLIVNIYAGLFGLIIFAALLMSVLIMQDTLGKPDILVTLKDETRALGLRNRGNAVANAVHVSVIPQNIEFDIPQLQVEETASYPFGTMIQQAKVVVTYQNERGEGFSKTTLLSAFDTGDDDLLKPAFPLFKWKKED